MDTILHYLCFAVILLFVFAWLAGDWNTNTNTQTVTQRVVVQNCCHKEGHK